MLYIVNILHVMLAIGHKMFYEFIKDNHYASNF